MIFLFEDDNGDWKENLDERSRVILAELLEKTKKHHSAYMEADDVKIAQLWSALVEMKMELDENKELIEKLKGPFKSIVALGEIEKRKAIERMVKDIIKPDVEQEEATQKLIDSLMKF